MLIYEEETKDKTKL